MRRLVIAGLMCGCGWGNWSIEDLEFASALPTSKELRSQLASATNQQPLSVGDPSETYVKTKEASGQLNTHLDEVLAGLDDIRLISPSTREDNRRIWGPYPDKTNPGFDVQIEITRVVDQQYVWRIQMRPHDGVFSTVGGGEFTQTTATLREGVGSFFFDAATARKNLMKPREPGDLDRIDFRYETDRDPVRVSVDAQIGAHVVMAYAFNGKADRSAALQYEVSASNIETSKVRLVAGWDPKTAGKATYEVLEGTKAGDLFTECWDPGHIVVYAQFSSDAGVYELGDAQSCAKVPTLDPL